MNIEWVSLSIGFALGILASFLGSWLFYKFVKWRRSRADHFDMSYAKNGMRIDVEGYDPSTVDIAQIVKDVTGKGKTKK